MDLNFLLQKSDIKLEGYGKNNFIVNGKKYFDPIIVLPNKVQVEKKLTKDNINKKFLNKIIQKNKLELLILGCDLKVKKNLSFKNISVEIMGTGAACRTINILLSEGRQVGALLFPIK